MNDYDHEDILAYFNNLDVLWERPAGNLEFEILEFSYKNSAI